MIYTSSKGRMVTITYSTLTYSDKQLGLHVLIIVVVARAKLKQSQLFRLTESTDTLQKSKLN